MDIPLEGITVASGFPSLWLGYAAFFFFGIAVLGSNAFQAEMLFGRNLDRNQ